MTPEIIIPDQLWLIRDFFPQEQYAFVRNLYRKAENNALKMIYDNRLLTDWSETREPNDICATWAPFFSELADIELKPQVGYVDITLSHAKIMMHRIHSDIKFKYRFPYAQRPQTPISMRFVLKIQLTMLTVKMTIVQSATLNMMNVCMFRTNHAVLLFIRTIQESSMV